MLDFFSVVLAQDTPGFRCIATPLPSGKWLHHFHADDTAAVLRAEHLAQRGKEVYFALGTFRDETAGRRGANAVAYRSVWVDLDVGASKPYSTQRDAIAHLNQFRKAAGLPAPLLVSSGYGVHAYWTLDQDVDPHRWRAMAIAFRDAMTAYGVGFDRSRATDLASVLRPPGTSNFKSPQAPMAVTILHQGGGPVDPQVLEAAAAAMTGTTPQVSGQVPKALAGAAVNNSGLTGGMSYPEADADQIADACAQVRKLRDVAQGLPQPDWFHAMQVVAFCTDGDAICHDWSAQDSRYSQSETDTKLAQIKNYKPTTCAAFHSKVDHKLCEACPHWGKINSPIKLGLPQPTNVVAVQKVDPVTGEELPPEPFSLPPGFTAQITEDNQNIIFASVPVKGGQPNEFEEVAICDVLFYPVQRVNTRDGFFTTIEMVPEREAARQFVVPSSIIAKGGAELHQELGKWEIVARAGMKLKMEAYLAAWQTKLRKETDQTRSYRTFGWNDEGFVAGRTLYTEAGPTEVTLTGEAEMQADAMVPRGDLDTWIDVINQAYNYPGQEAYQFMLLCSFASPLFALYEEYGGVTVYAYSAGTGTGKTTAQRAALSVWGNWKRLQINEGMATGNSFFGMTATLHNLPIMFDELTNIDPETAARYAFAISQGQPKRTMNSNREQRMVDDWSLIMLASGNTLLTEKIAGFRANSDAELARVFEFTVDAVSQITPAEASQLFPKLIDNYGHAGAEFSAYIAANRGKLRTALEKSRDAMAKAIGATQQERYWSALMGAVMLAHAITTKLGLVGFPREPLIQWATDSYQGNRRNRTVAKSDVDDSFGRMLNDLWSAILVTEGEGHAQTGTYARVVSKPIRSPLAGRCIIPPVSGPGNPGPVNVRNVLYLSVNEVRAWANKNGTSAQDMFAKAVSQGWAHPQHKQVRLGRGTEEFGNITSSVRCWEVDMQRVNAENANVPMAAKVTALVGGGTP